MFQTIDIPLVLTCLKWLAIISSMTFVLSIVLIPWFVGKLDVNCFLQFENDHSTDRRKFTVIHLLGVIFRNVIGTVLLVAGIAMLFLPGQGILTILLSLLFLSFPRKRRLFQALIRRRKIQQTFDWLRKKQQKQNFNWPNLLCDKNPVQSGAGRNG